MKLRNITYCGIITALLCVVGPIAIPISGIPFTLSTLIIYVTTTALDPSISIISILTYIFIGCLGLPVFSGFSGGITHTLGLSGGFILGYIPLVISITLLNKTRCKQIIGMCLGTVLLYVCGCIGYMINSKCNSVSLLSICVIPFIPGDILKIIITTIITPKIKYIFKKN